MKLRTLALTLGLGGLATLTLGGCRSPEMSCRKVLNFHSPYHTSASLNSDGSGYVYVRDTINFASLGAVISKDGEITNKRPFRTTGKTRHPIDDLSDSKVRAIHNYIISNGETMDGCEESPIETQYEVKQ